jgi:putative glutamine amidotransferase
VTVAARTPTRRRPVVGLTTYLERARWGVWTQPAALLPQSYVDAVQTAGGVPVLLPPSPLGAEEVAATLDALVLSGGADVDPVHYGEEAGPRTRTLPERDDWELALLRAALARHLPVLGICRGMQVLNVACGGTLHQHLPDVVGNSEHQPQPGVFGTNEVRITPASRLARILGRRATVACHHHQAVKVLGNGLGPAAWAPDETIEAIEHFEHEFVLGVQWHPEEGPRDGLLFAALVRAAAGAPAVVPQPPRPRRRLGGHPAPIRMRGIGERR